jgi:hypothetical protein
MKVRGRASGYVYTLSALPTAQRMWALSFVPERKDSNAIETRRDARRELTQASDIEATADTGSEPVKSAASTAECQRAHQVCCHR